MIESVGSVKDLKILKINFNKSKSNIILNRIDQ